MITWPRLRLVGREINSTQFIGLWLVVIVLYLLSTFHPVGFFVYVFISFLYYKIIFARCRLSKRYYVGACAFIFFVGGGFLFQMWVINAQITFLPQPLYRAIGPSGVMALGVSVFCSLMLAGESTKR